MGGVLGKQMSSVMEDNFKKNQEFMLASQRMQVGIITYQLPDHVDYDTPIIAGRSHELLQQLGCNPVFLDNFSHQCSIIPYILQRVTRIESNFDPVYHKEEIVMVVINSSVFAGLQTSFDLKS